MQVIIFDKKFKCLYRLHNIPKDGNFQQVYDVMEFENNIKDYDAIRLADHVSFCTDEFYGDGKQLKLTASNCE